MQVKWHISFDYNRSVTLSELCLAVGMLTFLFNSGFCVVPVRQCRLQLVCAAVQSEGDE